MTTPALGASQTGDLLLAFVSLRRPERRQTATVSGGGLTWSLVRRANTRLGTSEIWKAIGARLGRGVDRHLDARHGPAMTSR